MTARRSRRGAAAVRALRTAARAWLHAHRDAHAETAWLWRYGPTLGPTAPVRPNRAAPEEARAR